MKCDGGTARRRPAMKSYIQPAMVRNGTSHQRYMGTMMGSGRVMKAAESIMYLRSYRSALRIFMYSWR